MSTETPGHDHSGDELDPDEPRTPLWLPLLGLGLFLGALIYTLVDSDDAEPEQAPTEGSTEQAAEEE